MLAHEIGFVTPVLHETLHQLKVAGLHCSCASTYSVHNPEVSVRVFFPPGDAYLYILSLTTYGCVQSTCNYLEWLISYPSMECI